MPDISMCLNNECSKRRDCYRYRAVPGEIRQVYAKFKPYNSAGDCEYFWRIKPDQKVVPFTEEAVA